MKPTNGYQGDTAEEMLRRHPPAYSAQASCTDILLPQLTALIYDRLQPSNMILLISFPLLICLTTRHDGTNGDSSLISSSVSS